MGPPRPQRRLRSQELPPVPSVRVPVVEVESTSGVLLVGVPVEHAMAVEGLQEHAESAHLALGLAEPEGACSCLYQNPLWASRASETHTQILLAQVWISGEPLVV